MTTPDYTHLSSQLKLLAHPERLRILDAIRRDAECVCHLEALLDKPQPYVSQQLKILRDAGIITDEKLGQNVFYRLTDPEILSWLAVMLGTFDSSLPEMGGLKQEIFCICPKCNQQLSVEAESVVSQAT